MRIGKQAILSHFENNSDSKGCGAIENAAKSPDTYRLSDTSFGTEEPGRDERTAENCRDESVVFV